MRMFLLIVITVALFGCWTLPGAASRGNIKIVEARLEAGADVNAKDAQGHTVMDYARRRMFPEIIEMLKEVGAREEAS